MSERLRRRSQDPLEKSSQVRVLLHATTQTPFEQGMIYTVQISQGKPFSQNFPIQKIELLKKIQSSTPTVLLRYTMVVAIKCTLCSLPHKANACPERCLYCAPLLGPFCRPHKKAHCMLRQAAYCPSCGEASTHFQTECPLGHPTKPDPAPLPEVEQTREELETKRKVAPRLPLFVVWNDVDSLAAFLQTYEQDCMKRRKNSTEEDLKKAYTYNRSVFLGYMKKKGLTVDENEKRRKIYVYK